METHIETKRRGNVAAIVHVMTDSATPTRPFDNTSRLVMVNPFGQRSHRDLLYLGRSALTGDERCVPRRSGNIQIVAEMTTSMESAHIQQQQ